MNFKTKTVVIIAFISSMLFFSESYATDSLVPPSPSDTLDSIVYVYQQHAHQWEKSLTDVAKSLFWILAAIEFTWAGIGLVLRQADFSEWAAELVNRILFIGFFYSLLLNSADWARVIINSFMSAASTASIAAGGVGNISPSTIFSVGIDIGIQVMKSSSIFHPSDSVGLIIVAIIIDICFAYIAAMLVECLVEAYIVISAGVFFMGFGGSRWTKDYALKTIFYAISVGAKLFVIQLIIGLGQSIIITFDSQVGTQDISILILLGSGVVMAMLVKKVPDLVQGIVNGSSVGTGSALTGAAATVGGAALGLAAGIAGAGAAVGSAAKLASTQLTASGAKSGSLALGTMKNLGKSALQDVGRRLSGQSHHGSMAGRMASALSHQNTELKSDMQKPQLPQTPQPSPQPSKDDKAEDNAGNNKSDINTIS